MPQDRILYAHTTEWRVERVLKHTVVNGLAGHPDNPIYRAATPRWVFPACGVSEFHTADGQVLLDGLTVVVLPTGLPYQIHDWHNAPLSHMVVSVQPGFELSGAWDRASAWTLPPRALWQLRLHWRALAKGRERINAVEALLASHVEMACGRGVDHPAVARARRFMAIRTAGADGVAWSLHDVADAACCSYFHLARLFYAHTGVGLHAYRERLRLAVALQRLDDGESDLACLAHDLGYSSQSHWGAAFRRDVGVTPAQARQALQG